MNSIETVKYNQRYIFEDVTTRRQPSDYWMMQKFPSPQPQTQNPQMAANPLTSSFKIITPEDARKTKNTKVIGLSVAGATVLTGIGLFTLMRGGGNKKILQGLKMLKAFFEKKLENVKINNKNIEFLDKVYMCAIGVIETLTRKSEVVNNFTTFKDLLFKKIMHVTEPTGKIHDSITKLFTNIGRRSVESSYGVTENKIISVLGESRKATHRILRENPEQIIVINGKKATKSQWVKLLREMDENLQQSFYRDFDLGAQKKRYYSISQIAQNLESRLSKLRTFFSEEVYKGFIADEKIAKEKLDVQKGVIQYRKGISYTQEEMIKNSEESLSKVASFISFRDNANRNLLKAIKQGLKKYHQYPKDRAENGKNIIKAVDELSENIKNNTVERFISKENTEKVLAELNEIKTNITDYKQGIVEDILTIYKKLLPEKEYKKIKKVYTNSVKSLDSSIKLETEDFTNKLRDLTMGSAPTDMLTMVGSLSVLGYQLGKSDDKDQRTSIALKYGFPAISGIAVSLICNAKLFAGSKALLVGSISTWLLNRIGTISDDYIKEYKAKHNK